jgi:drug/metabolite transporter (DMT)-like permease
MVTIFALAAALCYGSADFLGGAATRRAPVLSVLGISASAGTAIVLVAALLGGGPPKAAGIGWGICAGAAGGVGLMFFYAGLAAGPMSVVAPLSSLVSIVLPVGVALAAGERPGPLVYVGALVCLVAIVLVSLGGGNKARNPLRGEVADPGPWREPAASAGPRPEPAASAGPRRCSAAASMGAAEPDASSAAQRRHRPGRGIWYGAASGVAFGMFFVFIRNGGESGALWPVAVSRVTGLAVVVAAAAVMRARPVHWRAGGRLFAAALMSGVLDATANIWYVLATRAGLLGVAVVLTSLYSGVTVLLARVLLGERIRPMQRAGLALAALGIVLVTV